MPPGPEESENLEDLLDAEDDEPRPSAPEPTTKSASTEAAVEKPAMEKAETPKLAARRAAAEASRGHSGWMVWALIVLLLLATSVGLGWYANEQRMQVADLKGQLDSVKAQATGMQATAAKAAEELLPTIEEHATIAKLRAASGDMEGAKYSLMLAKRYADMAERLSSGSPSSKLNELKAQIEETEKAVGGGAGATAEQPPIPPRRDAEPPPTPSAEESTTAPAAEAGAETSPPTATPAPNTQ